MIKDYSDENTIVDPETGITYTKIKTFTGKNDLISDTGGFNMSPDGRFMVLENKVVPLNGSDAFNLVDMECTPGCLCPGYEKSCILCRQRYLDCPCFS